MGHEKVKACDHLGVCVTSDLCGACQDPTVVERVLLRLGMQIVLQWRDVSSVLFLYLTILCL